MFKGLNKVIKDSEKLARLIEIDEAVKEYATASAEDREDIKNWLVDIIASDCNHDVTTDDYDGVVCEVCHAYTECYAEEDEDGIMITHNYDWSSSDLDTLYKESISKLSLKAMDLIRGAQHEG